jgi:hypothetical protein
MQTFNTTVLRQLAVVNRPHGRPKIIPHAGLIADV